jgi:FlaA1/EpsC-like NDP-sugar epimerase
LSGEGLSGAGTTATGMAPFANMVILMVKLFFALAFAFGLYGSYQKYNERAELQEIVQSPVVLSVVVLAIDGILGLIFK